MKFLIINDITKDGVDHEVTWVEAGVYEVIRLMDDNRLIIKLNNHGRLITIVNIKDGELLYEF